MIPTDLVKKNWLWYKYSDTEIKIRNTTDLVKKVTEIEKSGNKKKCHWFCKNTNRDTQKYL